MGHRNIITLEIYIPYENNGVLTLRTKFGFAIKYGSFLR